MAYFIRKRILSWLSDVLPACNRGSGASVVSIRPRVHLTGENTDAGPEEHSLDIDIFMGGVLCESMIATLAKAGLSFTDFPTFNLQCESSVSLR